jgi:hypothetical protein
MTWYIQKNHNNRLYARVIDKVQHTFKTKLLFPDVNKLKPVYIRFRWSTLWISPSLLHLFSCVRNSFNCFVGEEIVMLSLIVIFCSLSQLIVDNALQIVDTVRESYTLYGVINKHYINERRMSTQVALIHQLFYNNRFTCWEERSYD